MYKTLSDPQILLISVIVLTGVLLHVTQLNDITTLASSKQSSAVTEHFASKMSEAPKDFHIDLLAFSGDTYNMRSQPPTARPRENDETDQTNDRSIPVGDELADVYSQSTI